MMRCSPRKPSPDHPRTARPRRGPRGARLFAALVVSLLCHFRPLAAQHAIDVVHCAAVIVFDMSGQTLDAHARIVVRSGTTRSLDSFSLHLRDLTVTAVSVRDTQAPFEHHDGVLSGALPRPLPPGDTISIMVDYHGAATAESGAFPWGGCHWGETAYSMGVGFHASSVSMTRHWLPLNDVPSDKATFDLTFIVPDGYTAAGSGRLASVEREGGGSRYRWIEAHPTAPSLVTYAIGRYARVVESHRGLAYEYFVPRADSARAHEYFAPLPAMVAVYERLFGPYPFDKVGYCITPIGSMEHQTMISYAAGLFQSAIAGSTAAHELAHQWWGCLLTPVDFREAWLSEGFATFGEALCAEAFAGRDAYARSITMLARASLDDEIAEQSLPLYDFPRDPPSSNYPRTIYDKGASVLAMLRHIVGDTAFFAGLRTLRDRHAYGNITTHDVRHAIEEKFGRPLDWFFNEWVFRPGIPRYDVSRVRSTPGAPFQLRIAQGDGDTSRTRLYTMPLDIRIVTVAGDTVMRQIESHAVPFENVIFTDLPDSAISEWDIDPAGIIPKTLHVSSREMNHRMTPGLEHDRMHIGFGQQRTGAQSMLRPDPIPCPALQTATERYQDAPPSTHRGALERVPLIDHRSESM
jgi:aminopeptidase N